MTAPTMPAMVDVAEAIRDAAETNRVGGHTDTNDGLRGNLDNLAVGVAHPLVASAAYTAEGSGAVWESWRTIESGTEGRIWTDLRPSECIRLIELVRAAVDRAVPKAEAIILEAVIEAGVRFAEEFPDAPRQVAGSATSEHPEAVLREVDS